HPSALGSEVVGDRPPEPRGCTSHHRALYVLPCHPRDATSAGAESVFDVDVDYRDRGRKGKRMDDVADIEDINADWLSSALDTDVRSVATEQIGTGQTGAAYRLTIDADGVPPTMIAKVAAGDDAARQRVSPG